MDIVNKNEGSQCITLADVVYVPLNALSDANRKLSGSIVEQIAAVSENTNNQIYYNETPQLFLKNVQFIFEQINKDSSTGTMIKQKMGITTPLASIIPITALQVDNANIKFSAEPKILIHENNDMQILAKSAPHIPRKSDKIPKIKYNVKVKGYDMPEGIARIIDMMDINQIPEIVHILYIDKDGKPCKDQEYYNEKKILKQQQTEITTLLTQICDVMSNKTDSLFQQNITLYQDKKDVLLKKLSKINKQLLDNEIKYLEEIYG